MVHLGKVPFRPSCRHGLVVPMDRNYKRVTIDDMAFFRLRELFFTDPHCTVHIGVLADCVTVCQGNHC